MLSVSAWPPSLVNQSVNPAKCRANCFWDRKSRDGSSKGMVRGEGEGGYAFPFSAQILYLGLRCQTLYVNRNGFRPA